VIDVLSGSPGCIFPPVPLVSMIDSGIREWSANGHARGFNVLASSDIPYRQMACNRVSHSIGESPL
jgi:hypothetical protein